MLIGSPRGDAAGSFPTDLPAIEGSPAIAITYSLALRYSISGASKNAENRAFGDMENGTSERIHEAVEMKDGARVKCPAIRRRRTGTPGVAQKPAAARP